MRRLRHMRFSEILRLVWINLWGAKSKAALTSLGIIVGSATIVLVIAVGNGGQVEVAEQFKNLNAGAIEVSSVTATQAQNEQMDERASQINEGGDMFSFGGGSAPDRERGAGENFGGGRGGGSFGGGTPSMGMAAPSMAGGASMFSFGSAAVSEDKIILTEQDAADIRQLVPYLSSVSIIASSAGSVQGGDMEEESNYTIAGVLPEYQQITNLSLLTGSFVTQEDSDEKNKVCVIGNTTAKSIYGAAVYAYGQLIVIEGVTYEIVGVLNPMGTVTSGVSPDDSIYLPYGTALKYVFGSSADPQIAAVAEDVDQVDLCISNIKAVLSENHPDGYFSVTDAGSQMEAALSSANTLSMLLIAVAAIVFLVGGIGIMNVLFVTVKERTGEIGILKALGCSKSVILMEFLMEAALIAIIGGGIGVGVGYAAIPLAEMLGARMEPLASGGILALYFAVGTGTLFGFYPAFKASRLVPVEALTQE